MILSNPTERRWFIRCLGCLSVMAINGDRPQAGLRCGICSGRIEIMGIVHQDRLTKTEDRCACDERCTSATGPNCNCKCAGKNHGSGITVTVVIDLGGIPKATPRNKEKSLRIYGEWQAARSAVEERIKAYFKFEENKNSAHYWTDWNQNQMIRRQKLLAEIQRVERLRSRSARLSAIAKINEKLSILGRDAKESYF